MTDTPRIPPKRMARKLARVLRAQQPDANYVKKVFQYVRADLDLTGRTRAPRKLPELLTDEEMNRLHEAIWKSGKPAHLVLFKLLLYTGLRNAELVALELQDVDLAELKLRVRSGKGGVPRDVPLPESFRGELVHYLDRQRERGARYVLESRLRGRFTTRRIRQIFRHYALEAGIDKRLYPHLFRHQLLTFLTRKGVVDSQLQLVSGHRSRESLALYQTLSLADVQPRYQEAMKSFPVR